MARLLSRLFLSAVLVHWSLSAPGQPEAHREDDSVVLTVVNPFQSKEENHRLLQGYIDSILSKNGQERPETNSREQDVFFLFRLHDYDHSGRLDGLELIKLLNDFNAFYTPGFQSNDQVVSVVDFLLQTQDLNQDGLFSPLELLLPPLPTPHEENDTIKDVQNEEQIQMAAEPQQEEERTEEDAPVVSDDEQLAPQEAQINPVTGQAENMAPVHQGQPEI